MASMYGVYECGAAFFGITKERPAFLVPFVDSLPFISVLKPALRSLLWSYSNGEPYQALKDFAEGE